MTRRMHTYTVMTGGKSGTVVKTFKQWAKARHLAFELMRKSVSGVIITDEFGNTYKFTV